MRIRLILVAALAPVLLGAALLIPGAARLAGLDLPASPADRGVLPGAEAAARPPARSAAERRAPTLIPKPVRLEVDGFASWALLDRSTGRISGSRNRAATNSTESMIKVWVVADYLRRTAQRGAQPNADALRQASTAIRDSDDDAAEALYNAGGRVAVIRRMITRCELTDTTPGDNGWWSYTRMSARDAVRLGRCVYDGTAAGPRWTNWLLTEMARVRGSTAAEDQRATSGGGRWGIVDGLPQQILDRGVSIKNGWTLIQADQKWHVNCLAIGDTWVLAVLLRYPGDLGLDYGAKACQSVAEQLATVP